MPLLGVGDTTATSCASMQTESIREIYPSAMPLSVDRHESHATMVLLGTDQDFDESQCLFCDQTSSDLASSLSHMSKVHSLHIVEVNLLVDVASLLAYFHLVISKYHECLFCGTQRNTRHAVQQHMIAKGHCKYDLVAEDAEYREFYDLPSMKAEKELRRELIATHMSGNASAASHSRSSKRRLSRRSQKHNLDVTAFQSCQAPTPSTQRDSDTTADDAGTYPGHPGQLSTREQRQAYTLNNQLLQLRATDQRSLMHLPVSQQRAILATHHKQTEKARRSEQVQRGNLDAAGNSFARLGTIRLVRKPPHTGRVQTLKR